MSISKTNKRMRKLYISYNKESTQQYFHRSRRQKHQRRHGGFWKKWVGLLQEKDNAAKEAIEQSLYESTLKRDWFGVAKIFEGNSEIHSAKITKNEDTALHVAITHAYEKNVKQLLDKIDETEHYKIKQALSAKNKQGNTHLHSAAASGLKETCDRMLHAAPLLVSDRNKDGETPLFLAALHGHKKTFLCLHKVSIGIDIFQSNKTWKREDGDNILHCTIQRDHFDLALLIMHLYRGQSITSSVNESGITALHVLASKPSAFLGSTRLRWWTRILYHCIIVEPLNVKAQADQIDLDEVRIIMPKDSQEQTFAVDSEEHRTCLDFFGVFFAVINSFADRVLRGVIWSDRPCKDPRNSPTQDYQNQYFPPNYTTVCDLIKCSCRFFLGPLGYGLLSLRNTKQRHKWCAQIMDELVKQHSADSYHNAQGTGNENQSAQPNKMDHYTLTPLFMAAKNGATQLVMKILDEIPVAIQDVTPENKNILHVAVENRQPRMFKAILKYKIVESLMQDVDIYGNNVLHLAAKESKYKPWKIPGAAMQLQWEIKWYQFVRENAPPHLIFQTNHDDKTPEQIFTEGHMALVKEGSEWLKSTSESCSVVAALIAGVSFATSSTVPGGNDDKTGKPTLEGHPAFDLFAITSLVALCFSVTALVMFLAILTSRQKPKDFRRNLPFKLLLGLSSLFVSIAAILVSFCAAHFFELKDRLNKVVFFIYAVTCLPVSFYAIAQFPLYLDLLESILARVPQPSYKDDDL